jgi:hypothetical protein
MTSTQSVANMCSACDNSRSQISQSLWGTGVAPVALLTQIKPSFAERRQCLGARTAGSSELPQVLS